MKTALFITTLCLIFSGGLSQSTFRRIVRPSREITRYTHGCAHAGPNFRGNDGTKYILTFLNGCKTFTGEQADEYCKANGGRAISLDSKHKSDLVVQILANYAQRYIWTGGRINHNKGLVTWPSGSTEGYVRGNGYWSHTGGSSRSVDIPQPDNRDGNEVCLAVLNNFYADGIRWHDVGCSHKKPVICELR